MKITFIRPHLFNRRSSDALEPLVFAILAGLTPPDIDIAFFDERLENIPLDEPTDLVAITVETYTARRAYQIATSFRQRGVAVVLGGYHPSFLPDEALQYADSVVIGDAEEVWPELVDDARRSRMRPVYQAARQPPLEGLKFDRALFRGKYYPPIAAVQYGRGCRYACDFCSIHAFYGFNLRQRPIGEVVAEIEGLDRRSVLLVDDNLFVDVPRAEALFRALIPLKIRWGCQVSIDVARNPRIVQLMADSGCVAALVGFESLEAGSLRQMRKSWNTRYGSYSAAIRTFQEHGIMIYGSFVFGYDHDTPDIFDRTVDFALESKLFLVNFSALTPTPGAALYERLRAEGRLLNDRWWLDPGYRYGQATYRPRLMDADELTEGCLRARRRFYQYSSIARRMFASPTNRGSLYHLGLFLAANLVSRRELSTKLGRPLGADEPLESVQRLPRMIESTSEPRTLRGAHLPA